MFYFAFLEHEYFRMENPFKVKEDCLFKISSTTFGGHNMSKKEMKTKQDFMDLLHERKGSPVKALADDTEISFTLGEFRQTVNNAQVKRGLTINLLKMMLGYDYSTLNGVKKNDT